MNALTIWLILALVAFGLMVHVIIALDRRGLTFSSTMLAAASPVLALRLGCFWYLEYLKWTNQESLDLLPLAFFLFPEAFLVPEKMLATTAGIIALNIALVFGTLTWVALVTTVIRQIRRYPR